MTDSSHIAGKKILLVEDDHLYVDLIARKLTNSKCTFLFVYSGEEAIDVIQKNTPDVILLDVMLPGSIDGFGVLEKIKKDDKFKDIPVIILSNLSGPKDIERGMNLGAFRYLVKSSIVPSDILGHLESVFISKVK